MLFIYWSGSLCNIFSGSIFILTWYKLFFHFDFSTLRKLAKSTISLCIVLGFLFFFYKCSICETVEKHPANFEYVTFFCSVEWSHKDFILIFFSCTLFTLYMQNCFNTFLLQFLYTQSVENLRIDWWFAMHSSGSLLVVDNFEISVIILTLSLLITVVCWVRVSKILFSTFLTFNHILSGVCLAVCLYICPSVNFSL